MSAREKSAKSVFGDENSPENLDLAERSSESREKVAQNLKNDVKTREKNSVNNSNENSANSHENLFENPKISAKNVALYRKYRPQNLDEIIGQPQVAEVLRAAANSRNFAHAYLLTGQRGTGKTSVARILAHLINQTYYDPNSENSDIDIIEIDAASHGSVDDARELREKSAFAPLKSKYKIYIIDEVHMLSRQAFDALLKLIEEPPEHLRFILATTEIQKVPATILSRVQRFHFRPVAPKIVAQHLREISNAEKINIDDDALLLIAERGGGSFRDSITLLDQMSNYDGKISREKVAEILGLAPENLVAEIIAAISRGEVAKLVKILQNLFADGISAGILAENLLQKLGEIVPENPRFFALIEKLLDVQKSAAPDVKLLAILAEFASENSEKFAQNLNEKSPENSENFETKNNAKSQNKITENSANFGAEKSEISREKIDKNSDEKNGENKTLAQVVNLPKKSKITEENLAKIIEEKCEKMREKNDANLRKNDDDFDEKNSSKNLEKSDEKIREKVDEISEKSNEISREKVDERVDEKNENFAEKIEQKMEQKSGENSEKKVGENSQKIDKNSAQNSENSEKIPAEIDIQKIAESVKNFDELAIFGILKFADFYFENGEITFYFAKSFHRKKAETAKFREIILRAIDENYHFKPKITVAKTAVRENSDAAKILDVFGGEVVKKI